METATKPTKISRIDLRYRHLAQDVAPDRGSLQEREEEVAEQEEDPKAENEDETSSNGEHQERPVMGNAHRMFHRRQASASNVLTVVVDVVATVDSNSNVIALQTITPALPSVPAVPTDPLPSVPAVPPFPSDLTVPAYPWPSGVPSGVPASQPSSSQLVVSTGSLADAPPAPTLLSSSLGYNSTITNSILQTTSSFSSLNTTSSSSTISLSSSSSRPPGSSSSTRVTTQTPSVSSSAVAPSTSAEGGGGGGGAPVATAPPPAETNAAASSSGSDNNGTPTPTVVGSVVGSLAGVALILAVILLLLRRHKRSKRGGALQLSENDPSDHQPIASSGQQMATRSSVLPGGAAAFLNRFSGASKSTADTSTTTGERGFQRISGRKLPSAFSEGMTSEQFARGGEATLSGSSFYRDDQGFYGGPGGAANKEFGKEIGDTPTSGAMGTKERIMPSPARTPVVHHAGDAPPWGTSRNGGGSALSPPHSPNPSVAPRGTLGRSHPSHDGSRGSRFTEDV